MDEGSAMSVVEAPRQAWTPEQAIHEVVIDLSLLRDWTSPATCASAASELERVRQSLLEEGIVPSSASRIAAAVARYAFLTGGTCSLSRRALWRLHAVDGVPADVLAQLHWPHVRIRLREIAVPGESGTRYFGLSGESCRLLMLLRDRTRQSERASCVFVHDDGRVWQAPCLAEALSAISMSA
jgi:hypothetical protein